jgi:thymidylate synthase (FAD)
MKIVQPSYEIISCPDGEECLAKLERIGRIAYKSEDKIDLGREECGKCYGRGDIARCRWSEMDDCITGAYIDKCIECNGKGWKQVREPSSHKFIRKILKTDRREKLIENARQVLEKWVTEARVDGVGSEIPAKAIVSSVMDRLRNDPPHESVIEHEHITVLFTANRGFTHQLVRHRIASYTMESTRFCNYSKGKFGKQIYVTARSDEELHGELATWMDGVSQAENHYMHLLSKGVPPEIARDLLCNVLKADIVMTANLRTWRDTIPLRKSSKAHPDMRFLMGGLLEDLKSRIPIIFDGLE